MLGITPSHVLGHSQHLWGQENMKDLESFVHYQVCWKVMSLHKINQRLGQGLMLCLGLVLSQAGSLTQTSRNTPGNKAAKCILATFSCLRAENLKKEQNP